MKKQEIFQCRRCGAENIIGTRYCIICSEHYYYNCPHCNTWVDNSFINCPACQRPLNWPVTGNVQDAYTGISNQVPEKSKSGVAVLACSCLVLFVIAFVLISNNSVSAKPIDISSGPSQSQTSDKIYSADKESDSQQAISDISSVPDTTKPPVAVNSEILIIDVNASNEGASIETDTSYNLTNSYTPTRSAYLESLWPGWGHCSGGSCRNVTNSQ